jgi:hypothetical protein
MAKEGLAGSSFVHHRLTWWKQGSVVIKVRISHQEEAQEANTAEAL